MSHFYKKYIKIYDYIQVLLQPLEVYTIDSYLHYLQLSVTEIF